MSKCKCVMRGDGVVVEAAAQVVAAPAATARRLHARRRRPRTSVAHRSAFIQTHWMTGATHRRGVGGPAIRFGGWVAKNARGPWPRTAQLVDGAACEDDSYLKTAQRCRPAPIERPRQPRRFDAEPQLQLQQ